MSPLSHRTIAALLASLALAPVLALAGSLAAPAAAQETSPAAAQNASPAIHPFHAATRLGDGRVLVTGGGSVDGTTAADVYDPATGRWSPTAALLEPRVAHTSTLLQDGRVLVTGGGSSPAPGTQDRTARASAEIYDPTRNAWALTAGPMAQGRGFHTATLLDDGRVLVVGGEAAGHGPFFTSAELFDPATGTFSAAAELPLARAVHTATLLKSGSVLVAGGVSASHGQGLRDAVVYDPASNSWTTVPSLMAVERFGHSAALLDNGTVLLAGGAKQSAGTKGDDLSTSAEIFDPLTNRLAATAPMGEARYHHTATVLPDGKVLVLGGADASDHDPSPTAEVYDPATRQWAPTQPMSSAPRRHTATLLTDGRVLVLSETADTASGPVSGVELYTPPGTAAAQTSAKPDDPDRALTKDRGKSGSNVGLVVIIGILVATAVAAAFIARRRRTGS